MSCTMLIRGYSQYSKAEGYNITINKTFHICIPINIKRLTHDTLDKNRNTIVYNKVDYKVLKMSLLLTLSKVFHYLLLPWSFEILLFPQLVTNIILYTRQKPIRHYFRYRKMIHDKTNDENYNDSKSCILSIGNLNL